MATRTPFEAISHTRRVCSVYKKICRNILDWTPDRAMYRYRCCQVRAEFDKKRDIKDVHECVRLVKYAEKQEYDSRHYAPFQFPTSPGGIDFERFVIPPDWVLDFWDPIEKAMYPEFFKLREQRKREYITYWQKRYGKDKSEENPAAAH